MTFDNPEDDPNYGVITEQDYIDSRKLHAGMEPIIPDIFTRAVVGDGIRADVLIGYDDDAADASP